MNKEDENRNAWQRRSSICALCAFFAASGTDVDLKKLKKIFGKSQVILYETKTGVTKSEEKTWKKTKTLQSCLGTGVEASVSPFHLAEPLPSRRIMGSVTVTVNEVYLISKRGQ